MGAVYEAHDLRLDRVVAVKIMRGRAFGQQTALRRFNREARAVARLTHPNIVRVYDIGSLDGDGAYFVMERLLGATLRAELDRVLRMPPALAADWFGPVIDGIEAAHAAGLVHRDLKPENVMGSRHGGTLEVKLLDLGLVKVRADELRRSATMTAEGVVMGTLGYMAPEQLLGREVDERADIYSIGIMLFEALTGRRPDADPRGSEPRIYRLQGPGPATGALDGLLQRCLAADPRHRLASAAVLRTELVPLLRACGEEVVASVS
jgi:serine/threonine-protein kinase